MNQDLQQSLFETVQIIAQERLKNVNFTKSYTGIIRSVNGLKCTVEAFGQKLECTIPHNLASFIGLRDIVIVQDIDNKGITRIVQGVINSLDKDMFHIYDPIADKIVSGNLQLWDEELQKPIDVIFELE